MSWDLLDFAVFLTLLAILIGGVALACRNNRSRWYRSGFSLMLFTGFLLIWMNAAVGLIGREDNPANLMYFAVLFIGAAGGIVTRARAAAMAHILFVMGFAQIIVGTIAMAGNLGAGASNWPMDIVILTTIFTTLWMSSGLLFRKAAQDLTSASCQ